ncbi:MAG: hypothetical protein EOM54_08675 [Clostridia bacterium]|nr:hypothetical protein [Clostridia bacterium]
MARKSQKQYIDENFNPFAPRQEDFVDHTKKLLFTWIFMAAGAVVGLIWGFMVGDIAISILFSTVIGIALGSALDSRYPREGGQNGKHNRKK